MKALLIVCCISTFPTAAFAQAAIAGLVTDATRGLHSGVVVVARSTVLVEKTRTTVTDQHGRYRIENLRVSEAAVPRGALVKFREPSPWDRYKFYILGAMAMLLTQTALIVGLLVQRTRRRRAEEEVRRSEAQLRTTHSRIKDLASRLLNAQEAERSRIARELHDDISQQLTLLTIDLELLAGGGAPEQQETLADEALHRAQEIATSLHDLSQRLHPAKLRLLGLACALQALQREVSQSEISVTLTYDNIPTLPPDLTVCLFRIVQEAMQNAVKHSGADGISVHLARGVRGITLSIVDDGIGFDVDAAWGTGLGLVSMRERLDAISGTLEIHSERGVGTRVEVWAPLPMTEDTKAAAI
jgi:signal transduction histidine kinase